LQLADPPRRDGGPEGHDVIEAIRLPSSSGWSAPSRYEPPPEEMIPGEEVLSSIEHLLRPSPVPVDEMIRLWARHRALQMALLELTRRLIGHGGDKVSLCNA
jgi:hypothetical protein